MENTQNTGKSGAVNDSKCSPDDAPEMRRYA